MPAEWIELAKNVGPSTAIAILIIVRLERRIDALTDALVNLPSNIAKRACGARPEECPFKTPTP